MRERENEGLSGTPEETFRYGGDESELLTREVSVPRLPEKGGSCILSASVQAVLATADLVAI